MLDRGQIDDWFGSGFIVTFAAISATALLLFIPWELNRPQPLIDIKMLTGRQFGTCFVIMLVTGALLIATTQILPQLLQEEFGYTATLAGLAISPGGAVTMVMMVVVGRLGFVQPRYLIAIGAAIACYAMIDLLTHRRRLRLLVFRLVAHLSRDRPAADLHSDHHRILRWHSAWQDRPGFGADQSGAKFRRIDGRGAKPDRAGAARAVSSEPAGRASRLLESVL